MSTPSEVRFSGAIYRLVHPGSVVVAVKKDMGKMVDQAKFQQAVNTATSARDSVVGLLPYVASIVNYIVQFTEQHKNNIELANGFLTKLSSLRAESLGRFGSGDAGIELVNRWYDDLVKKWPKLLSLFNRAVSGGDAQEMSSVLGAIKELKGNGSLSTEKLSKLLAVARALSSMEYEIRGFSTLLSRELPEYPHGLTDAHLSPFINASNAVDQLHSSFAELIDMYVNEALPYTTRKLQKSNQK